MTQWRDGRLGARDGRRLYWQAWSPTAETKATAVIVHGVGEHAGRYRYVAERLADAGISVYALDHRGHGRSDGPRGLIEGMDRVVDDLRQFIERVVEARGVRKPFLIGHSLGGAVSLACALREPDAIAGLVLSGPAVATEAVSPAMVVTSRVLSAIAPRLPVFQLDAALICRDEQVVQAYLDDPLVYSGKLPARTLWQILASMRSVPVQVPALEMPLLLLHGGEDQLCPPSGSQMIFDRANAPDRTLKVYPGLYHEIFNEPERDTVVDEMTAWILERADPAPVGRPSVAEARS